MLHNICPATTDCANACALHNNIAAANIAAAVLLIGKYRIIHADRETIRRHTKVPPRRLIQANSLYRGQRPTPSETGCFATVLFKCEVSKCGASQFVVAARTNSLMCRRHAKIGEVLKTLSSRRRPGSNFRRLLMHDQNWPPAPTFKHAGAGSAGATAA